MDELLKAIEELKWAYRESGAKSVKIELDGGDIKCVEIDNLQQTCNKLDTNLQQKPITNREWLHSLSDEELAKEVSMGKCVHCLDYDDGACRAEGSCIYGLLAWLRAEHRGDKND